MHGIRLYLRETSAKCGHQKRTLILGPDSLRIVTVIVPSLEIDTHVELSNSSELVIEYAKVFLHRFSSC